ncbi:YraN family protein [uncultured Castellaniella sp.]|uniref:YraN family protein n=1 Tax=uncultured Castellaniella sp. TaxID=647907 RepID=UPI0026279071|nr:YraN family protein [uncultured Castellaniella sp.]
MSIDSHARAQEAQRLARQRRQRALRAAARQPAPQATPEAASAAAGSPTQRRGHAAETRAALHLGARGVPTLARNLRCRAGEIDLVARDGPVLVFVEVRQRRDRRYGGAAASVNRAKQARLIRAARYFLPALSRAHFAGVQPPCRFDVVSIEDGRIDWIRDAFRM